LNEKDFEMIEGIRFEFEDIANDTTFQGNESTTTWFWLKEAMKSQFTKEILSKLKKLGIKRIEIGSIAWFSFRRKTKGRFISLNTMFMARLLKR